MKHRLFVCIEVFCQAYRIEPVTFTSRVKEALAYPVRGKMEDKKVRIPYRPEVRADLRAVTKETTAAGNIRFTAERSENGHADRFWALALAIHAAGTDSGPAWAASKPVTAARDNFKGFSSGRSKDMLAGYN